MSTQQDRYIGARYAAKSGSTGHSFARWEGQDQLWLTMSSSTDYIGKSRQSKGRYKQSQYSLANRIWWVKTNVRHLKPIALSMCDNGSSSGSMIYV
jgi:hypothetical protein